MKNKIHMQNNIVVCGHAFVNKSCKCHANNQLVNCIDQPDFLSHRLDQAHDDEWPIYNLPTTANAKWLINE